jgi:two-component system CheB/CheR fusion protein
MAFVLVQHLAPDHKSLLTELVKRFTWMQVFAVEDGMVVQADCVYVIPPNRDLTLLGGRLQLLEQTTPRGHHLPIDFFFRSLAQDQGERAIGIVLSGTGSDGTLGIRSIKGEGGMAMAQTPESTEYSGMPQSAIATGLVDYILPPEAMPPHRPGPRPGPGPRRPPRRPDPFDPQGHLRPAEEPDGPRLLLLQAEHHPAPGGAAHGGPACGAHGGLCPLPAA